MIEKNLEKWCYLGFALLSFLVFFANGFSAGPVIYADEHSYFANAAVFAGYENDLSSSYHSGYSLLISPAFFLAEHPQTVWLFIKIINALLYLGFLVALWSISHRLSPDSSPMKRLLVVLTVGLYPHWVIMVGYSFANMALVPLYALVVLLLARACERESILSWLVLGLYTSVLYWVHPTALATFVALALTASYVSVYTRSLKPVLYASVGLAGGYFFYEWVVTPWVHSHQAISGMSLRTHYPESTKVLSRLVSPALWLSLVAKLGGQVFYLSLATGGTIVAGFLALIGKIFSNKNSNQRPSMDSAVPLFLLLSLLGAMAVSALFLAGGQRIDHFLYGRYLEPVIGPVMLAGLLLLPNKYSCWAISVAVVAALLLWTGFSHNGVAEPVHLAGFWQIFALREQGLLVWLIVGVIIIGCIGLSPGKASLAILAGLFMLSSYFQLTYHYKQTRISKIPWSYFKPVRQLFSQGKCIGFDHENLTPDSVSSIYWYAANYYLYDYKMVITSKDIWYDHCDGPFFSYDETLQDNDRIRLVATSQYDGPRAWVRTRIEKP